MAKRHGKRVGGWESLFLRLEELVLANSGEDGFEEVFKLIVAKLWDERSGASRFRRYADDRETHEAICDLLREAEKACPGILEGAEPSLTPEHLAVCVEALAQNRISDAGLEVMDAVFEFLVAKGSKGSKGQYFTPRHVVELCVRMLKPTAGETVLDPACGSGGFLIHTLNYVRAMNELRSPSAMREYCSTKLWGFDVDSRAVRVGKALMVLAGDGSANIIRLNSLLRPDMGGLFPIVGPGEETSTLTIEDVCRSRLRRHRGFDVILTNPPFAGEVRERHVLDEYDLARGRPRIERDVLFLERCIELLRPGGRLAIVLPHNKFAVDTWDYAREWLVRKARVLGVVGLGRNTFLPHTHQKASVLFAQRRAEGDAPRAEQKVFFAVSERDGKSSKGEAVLRSGSVETDSAWDKIDHDLGDVAVAFDEFCKGEGIPVKA